MFSLLVVVVKFQYLPSNWLERLIWGSLTVARGSSPESPDRRVLIIFFGYCIISLLYYVTVLSPGHKGDITSPECQCSAVKYRLLLIFAVLVVW